MNKYVLVTTTCSSKEEAENIVNILLEKRLISCGQITKINSTYWWQARIINSDEFLIQMKSKKILFTEIENEIIKNHSYEVPEIVCYDITNCNKDFFNWIDKETK